MAGIPLISSSYFLSPCSSHLSLLQPICLSLSLFLWDLTWYHEHNKTLLECFLPYGDKIKNNFFILGQRTIACLLLPMHFCMHAHMFIPIYHIPARRHDKTLFPPPSSSLIAQHQLHRISLLSLFGISLSCCVLASLPLYILSILSALMKRG